MAEEEKVPVEDKAKGEIFAQLGITPEALEEIKKTVGKVEATKISGRWFIYRSLKRAELKMLRANVQGGDELSHEEKIVSRCLVLPKLDETKLRDDDAGLASTLTELIYNFSGYAPESASVKL